MELRNTPNLHYTTYSNTLFFVANANENLLSAGTPADLPNNILGIAVRAAALNGEDKWLNWEDYYNDGFKTVKISYTPEFMKKVEDNAYSSIASLSPKTLGSIELDNLSVRLLDTADDNQVMLSYYIDVAQDIKELNEAMGKGDYGYELPHDTVYQASLEMDPYTLYDKATQAVDNLFE